MRRAKLILLVMLIGVFLLASVVSAHASGVINGYVKGSDGRYLMGADVWCDATFLGETNSSGWYSFSVGAGNHRFTYGGVPGYENYVSPIITIYDGKSTRHDAVLPAHKGRITGTVKGSDGLLLTNVDVWCDSTFLGKTDLDGNYSFSVGAGNHRFTYGGVPGYKNYVSQVIRIYPDQTARQDVALNKSGGNEEYFKFFYGGYTRVWHSKCTLWKYNTNAVSASALSESTTFYDVIGIIPPPWEIDFMQTWVRLYTPSGYNFYWDSGKLQNRSKVAVETYGVEITRGTYYAASTHRYWEGSLYYYKALFDAKRYF